MSYNTIYMIINNYTRQITLLSSAVNRSDQLMRLTGYSSSHVACELTRHHKWDQVGSSGINFDPDSEIVRFGAIFEYCCDIVRILFLGAIFSDFWQLCGRTTIVAVPQPSRQRFVPAVRAGKYS